jgi:hypothetical protein
MNHYHLIPSAGVWSLTLEGSRKVIAEFESKSAALSGSAKLLLHHESTLKIHRSDGSVDSERAFHLPPGAQDDDETRWEEEPMPGLAPYTFK